MSINEILRIKRKTDPAYEDDVECRDSQLSVGPAVYIETFP